MNVVVIGTEVAQIGAVAASLRSEGIRVTTQRLDNSIFHSSVASDVSHAVLILSERAVIPVGDKTRQVSKALPPSATLLLCTAQMSSADRETLRQCGTAAIISPSVWAVPQIVERILAELILAGAIEPMSCGRLRGASRDMRELYEQMRLLAPLTEPILILGETGTGKELVAQELHSLSQRPSKFLPVNCPEIDKELLSSELFGHVKGSFTNAVQSRKGLFVAAGRGTIFLDEIGELELNLQSKLLRVLEDKRVRPVGANDLEIINARIVMATNRDLELACQEKTFRFDLFHRMKGFTLKLPPLRERKADLPLLVHHFVDAYRDEYKTNLRIPDGSLDCLFSYDWPGNVRELRAVIWKAAAFADSNGNLSSIVLNESVTSRSTSRGDNTITFDPLLDTWQGVRHRTQKAYFRAVLAATEGNITAAAKLAGIGRTQFYEYKEKLKLEGGAEEDL
jgi:transcriptional regulator with GAF, ATPase, and Fis domain